MNKKGFTLVELLAIIILLVGIFMLTYPKLTEMYEREHKKLDDDKITLIFDGVDRYLDNNDKYPPIVGTEYCIEMETLEYEGQVPDFDLEDEYAEKAVYVKIGKSSNYHKIIDECPVEDTASSETNPASP